MTNLTSKNVVFFFKDIKVAERSDRVATITDITEVAKTGREEFEASRNAIAGGCFRKTFSERVKGKGNKNWRMIESLHKNAKNISI